MLGKWLSAIVTLGLASGFSAGSARAGDLSLAELTEMEQLLARLNFDPGAVDGEVDDRTRTAIRLYQEFAVLPVDGEPDAKLLRELRQVSQVYAEMRATTPVPEVATPAEPDPAPAAEAAAAASVAAPDVARPLEPSPAVEPAVPAPAPEAAVAAPAPGTEPAAAKPPVAVARPAAPEPEPDAAQAADVPAKVAPKVAAAPAGPEAAGFNIAGMIARLKQRDHAAASAPSTSGAGAAPAAPTDSAGGERTLIWQVQRELGRIGLDPGVADGNLRTRTTGAIATYQRARGIPVDGQVSEELLARLAAEAPPPAPQPQNATAPLGSVTPQAAAIDAVPSNGYQAFRAGYSAAQTGDYGAAVKLYDQAIDGGDLALEHVAAALYNRANAYQYLGLLDKAIDDYSAAIANKPGFPAAYYNRGFALDLTGEKARAVEDFRKARDLGLQRLGVRSPDLPPPLL